MLKINTNDIMQWMSKKYIVTHNDLDGLISFALLKKCFNDKQIIGFYDLNKIVLFDNVELNDILFLDLDMENLQCIGHHKKLYYSEKTLNPNYLVQFDSYYNKYPFNTFMFLMYLFNISVVDLPPLQRYLMFVADSVAYNIITYTDNTKKWDKLLRTKVLESFQDEGEEIQKITEKLRRFTGESKEYPQFKFSVNDKKTILKYCNFIQEVFEMDWNIPQLDIKLTIQGEKKTSDKENFIKFVRNQKNNEIISHSLIYKDTVSFTQLVKE